ncbi:rhomboid family intramembrane serine protease [Reichenbachiella carrageenanivorans]|uniref:Rhomboid family intramembrane serine protease n=1 Tax=Reichenbachiella carrageenanivorans TaxID=2979869 RepID=A0ABY6CXA8_9BACT|nr:rhomboid family intramembrane serine protease [Reichenbachiella carrageenanivorans]UXX78556.1 rhomboid family intramembrane serine protease [Reichenbachiella carrageenanivorans]
MYTRYRASIIFPLRLTFVIWLVFTFQFYSHIDLGFLGVYPRTVKGLVGILTAPLIHGNTQHILSNTLPLLFLGITLFVFYNRIALWVFINCYFLTSILVWFFGRPFYHIGASGVIYGLAFFLIFFGLFRKDFRSLAISIVVVILYGGLVYGMLPTGSNISWESHAFGAFVGIALAFVYRHMRNLD